MYGLPEKESLLGLIGKQLIQVCIGSNEVIFRFEDDVEICVESPFEHSDSKGEIHSYDDFQKQNSTLPELLASNIAEVDAECSRSLVLRFSNGDSLRLVDDSDAYESFQIKLGGKCIVV